MLELETLRKRVEELERELTFALDAAAKGDKARLEAAGMAERIKELELSHAELVEALSRLMKRHDYEIAKSALANAAIQAQEGKK